MDFQNNNPKGSKIENLQNPGHNEKLLRSEIAWFVGRILAALSSARRLTDGQFRGLCDIAETYGNGELRFTGWQNALIPNIADRDVDDVKRELDLIGLGDEASSVRAGLVACTGCAGRMLADVDNQANAVVSGVFLTNCSVHRRPPYSSTYSPIPARI